MVPALALFAAVHHYIFFGLDRAAIHSPAFLASRAEGAQLKYTWRELEPARDRYDFSAIRSDLAFLRAHGKKLFVQIQEVSFDASIVNVPAYVGVAPQYDGAEDHAKIAGWVARRWDPNVRQRFALLLRALGREFDGRIEGVNLPETSVDFGENGRLFPPGFTCVGYTEGVIANLAALREAFPHSVVIQYANFMPCEWLPGDNKGYLDTVFAKARAMHAGVGGPDLLPYRKGQMNHSYPRIRDLSGVVPTGIAVQEGNYDGVTTDELLKFATEYLRVDYIFWGAQAPFYERDVLPLLARLKDSG